MVRDSTTNRLLATEVSRAPGGSEFREEKEELLRKIAMETVNFTGADLEALIYSARLTALKEKIARSSLKGETVEDIALFSFELG